MGSRDSLGASVVIVHSFTPELVVAEVARVGRKPSANPESLLRSLVRDRHNGPLEFARIDLEVEASIQVARHLVRYRTASWNERSLRTLPPLEFHNEYENARANGATRQEAAALIPLGARTRWRWQLPAPTLLHVFDQRLTRQALPETRATVAEIYGAVFEVWPQILGAWRERADPYFG